MSATHIQIDEGLAEYLRSVSVREPEILTRLRTETAQLPNAQMQITPEQGQFMGLLAAAIGARKALEVGVFTGYSSLSVAAALPPGGKLIACDVNEQWTSIARRYWKEAGVESRIDLRLGPALDTLEQIMRSDRSTFDFAFIDADKVNYQKYYELTLQLLRPGGLVLVDNVLWHGRVIDDSVQDEDTRAIRRFNETLHGDDRVEIAMIPIGDGLTIARKRGGS
jgi:predicted O-methyltransferase YrrM